MGGEVGAVLEGEFAREGVPAVGAAGGDGDAARLEGHLASGEEAVVGEAFGPEA